MKHIIQYKLKIVVILLTVICFVGCSKETEDINNLDTTIFVRHKKADMPAYIHGNASEKVFLIILHGGPGGTGLDYRVNTIKSEIEKNNAVVYFDQRGCGNSQGSYSESDLSVDLMAEDILALVKVIKAKYGDESRFFLMGHSWGGTLGPATLLKNQDDFLGWIDVDGSHSPKHSYNRSKEALKERAYKEIAKQNSIKHWENVLNVVKNVAIDYNDDDFFKLNLKAHESEGVLEEDNVINKSVFEGDYAGFNLLKILWNGGNIISILTKKGLYKNTSFTDQLHKITIPSLVLWGKYDIIVPTLGAQEAYDNLGSVHKELFIFEHSAHSPMFTEPDLFAEKVMEFINTHK